MAEGDAGEILIVDDNPTNLDLLSGILRAQRYLVRAATSGRRALATARAYGPELVMLDVTMPEMDGYAVCRELKADPATGAIPVLFLSALTEPIDKVRAFEAGGVDYVTKPFDASEVLARVGTQLQIARLRRELSQRNAELEQSNELKNRFLGMAAHDLRTPLTLVSGYAQMAALDGEMAETTRGYLGQIQDAGAFMRRLVDDLLDLSAIEAGRLVLERRTMDLGPVVASAVDRGRLVASAKGVMVEQEASPAVTVEADEMRVRAVLDNLIGNAVKFSPAGTRVTVSTNGEAEAARVTVADQGPGIPALELALLFEPFQKTSVKPTAGEKSTGLGLAIARKIVNGHGGRIWAESEPGRGTAFHFTLPRSGS